jgi:cystine transport system substrate-binding protein
LLGQAKGLRGFALAASAACACLLVAISTATGTTPSGSAASLEASNANLAARSRAAVLELYSLDTRLTAADGRLAALQAATAKLQADRADLRRELHVARIDARLSQLRLASRLRFIYEQGTTSSLDLVMGAKSLEDALTQLDDYDRVAASNATVLLEVLSSRKELTRLSRDLEAREQSLAAALLTASQDVEQLRQLTAERTSYISQLAQQRSLNAAKIANLTEIAQAADVRSQALVPPTRMIASPMIPATISAPATTAPTGHTLTVVATGYDLPGRTSTGLPVGWGIAAVDPSVIPLGTHIMIPGYGEAIAADTGTSIVGTTVDLWFPTAAQAYAWGRRTLTIAVN